MNGIDAPEKRGDEKKAGLAATDGLEALIETAQALWGNELSFLIRSLERPKYHNRIIAQVLLRNGEGVVVDLSKYMLSSGLAKKYGHSYTPDELEHIASRTRRMIEGDAYTALGLQYDG